MYFTVQKQPQALKRLTFDDGPMKKFSQKRSLLMRLGRATGNHWIRNNCASSTTSFESESDTPTRSGTSPEDYPNSDDDSMSEGSQEKELPERRCCLLYGCWEPCTCCYMPTLLVKCCDGIYYKIQNCTAKCPAGLPSIVPRPQEEEWNSPDVNAREFACCPCCHQPGGLLCIKCLDFICCPICPMWELCKGCDYGYRRFRIQLVLHRYRDEHKKTFFGCI